VKERVACQQSLHIRAVHTINIDCIVEHISLQCHTTQHICRSNKLPIVKAMLLTSLLCKLLAFRRKIFWLNVYCKPRTCASHQQQYYARNTSYRGVGILVVLTDSPILETNKQIPLENPVDMRFRCKNIWAPSRCQNTSIHSNPPL
jgi:hypothetical protein